jgi:hypothetical protein
MFLLFQQPLRYIVHEPASKPSAPPIARPPLPATQTKRIDHFLQTTSFARRNPSLSETLTVYGNSLKLFIYSLLAGLDEWHIRNQCAAKLQKISEVRNKI